MNSPLLYVRQVKGVVVDNVVHNEGRLVVGSVFLDYKSNKLRKREFCSYCHVIIELDTRSTKSASVFDTFKRSSQQQHKRSNVMLKGRHPKLFLGVSPSAFSNKYQKWWFSKEMFVAKITKSQALRS